MTFHVLPYNLRTEHRMDKVWLTFLFLVIQELIWYAFYPCWGCLTFLTPSSLKLPLWKVIIQ